MVPKVLCDIQARNKVGEWETITDGNSLTKLQTDSLWYELQEEGFTMSYFRIVRSNNVNAK